MGIRCRELRGDGAFEVRNRFVATAGLLQEISEPQVRLWIRRIATEDVAESRFERGAVQFSRDDARELCGKFPAFLRIGPDVRASAAATHVAQCQEPGASVAIQIGEEVALKIGRRAVRLQSFAHGRHAGGVRAGAIVLLRRVRAHLVQLGSRRFDELPSVGSDTAQGAPAEVEERRK